MDSQDLQSQLLVDLGMTKSHSRPHTSDDNPFSAAPFKTSVLIILIVLGLSPTHANGHAPFSAGTTMTTPGGICQIRFDSVDVLILHRFIQFFTESM